MVELPQQLALLQKDQPEQEAAKEKALMVWWQTRLSENGNWHDGFSHMSWAAHLHHSDATPADAAAGVHCGVGPSASACEKRHGQPVALLCHTSAPLSFSAGYHDLGVGDDPATLASVQCVAGW